MKNVKKEQCKKCIFMEFEDYMALVNNITGGLQRVGYDYDGLYYEDTDEAEKSETYWNEEITESLSKYFDVTVTSVHADDSDILCIWICYQE